jgi:hypothetical protein
VRPHHILVLDHFGDAVDGAPLAVLHVGPPRQHGRVLRVQSAHKCRVNIITPLSHNLLSEFLHVNEIALDEHEESVDDRSRRHVHVANLHGHLYEHKNRFL